MITKENVSTVAPPWETPAIGGALGSPLETFVPVSFIPLHDRILVRRIEAETERGGILIPSNAVEKPQLADVLAIGAGRLLDSGVRVPLDVQVGDRVMFGKFSGSEVQLNGELLLILREDEVLGRIPA